MQNSAASRVDACFGGKTAIVTGAASGIGRALAAELLRAGARVVLADIQADRLAATVSELKLSSDAVRSEIVDVSSFASVAALVGSVADRHGRLDFMFNNAGIAIGGGAHHYAIEDWQRVISVNLNGVVHGVQAAYPRMVAQGSGHIVNTASTAGLVPSGRAVGYTATKHAIVGLSTSLRQQAARLGVKVTVLCPGVVHTDLLTGSSPHGRELVPLTPAELNQMIRALRPVSAEVFARAALRAVRRNDALFVHGGLMRLLWWVYRLSPALGIRLDDALLQASPLARTLR